MEKALTWRKGIGFTHNRIDSGERRETVKRSPVLMPDGLFDKIEVLAKFKKAARKIDPEIFDFVVNIIKDY